jgi:hypothetical protein
MKTENEIKKKIKEIEEDIQYMGEKGFAHWTGKKEMLMWVLKKNKRLRK